MENTEQTIDLFIVSVAHGACNQQRYYSMIGFPLMPECIWFIDWMNDHRRSVDIHSILFEPFRTSTTLHFYRSQASSVAQSPPIVCAFEHDTKLGASVIYGDFLCWLDLQNFAWRVKRSNIDRRIINRSLLFIHSCVVFLEASASLLICHRFLLHTLFNVI